MRHFDLTHELNPEQCKAASTHHGPLLVIAGAGSGKTRMLTYRIASMLEEGIDERNILALTFTNKAAREMAERIRTLTDEPLKHLATTTFHSFGLGVLKQFIQHLGFKNNFTIYDTNDKLALIHGMLTEGGDDASRYDLREVGQLFSDIKTSRSQLDPNGNEKMAILYREYVKMLKAYNAVDFDDLITLPLQLFEKKPEVLEKLRNRYQYILVDEFQDTSLCQYRLVSQIAMLHRNLCVVGDDDQSIYSWRGANYQNLLLFEKDFPERLEVKLEENYRSSGTILQAANDLIIHNKQRKEKKLWTHGEKGSIIALIHPSDAIWEAKTIANQIEASMRSNKELTFDDFAVLVRTNRLMDSIVEELETRNLPLNITGGPNLLDRKEVRDILAYLKVISNLDDDVNFLRIVNTPTRGIGRATIEKIRKVADTFDCSLFDAAKRIGLSEDASIPQSTRDILKRFCKMLEDYQYEFSQAEQGTRSFLLRRLVNQIGYESYLSTQSSSPEKIKYQMKGIEIFCKKLQRFEQKHEQGSILQFLTLISLDANDDEGDTMGKINVMTMHASKGLEWHTVFLAAIEEPYVPNRRALEEDPHNIDEERRLFYVAITRAKKNLIISSCLRREHGGTLIECLPSRFIKEIPESLLSEEDPNALTTSEALSDKLAQLKKLIAMKENK